MSKSTFYLQAKVKWTLGIIQEVFRRLLHQEIWKRCNFAWAPTILHDWAKWKTHQQQFRLLGAFRMTVQNFRMVLRNQFLVFPLSCSQNSFPVHFTRLCEFFTCSCKIEKHSFSTPFCIFFHFFLLIPLQPPPNQFQIPIQTNYITYFIVHLDHHQLYLLSSIWFISFGTNLSKSYLEMTQKLHKTC